MGEWTQWSDGWIKEGHFVSYIRDGVHYFEHVIMRDLAHWEYVWHEDIDNGDTSGPYVPTTLEITKGYDSRTNSNHIWQVIFGIKGQPLLYIELPTDLHRHGIPKEPKPSADHRKVSHFQEFMSQWREPTFLTEHFLMRPECIHMALSAYNDTGIDLYRDQEDFALNFFINKMITERIGTVTNGVLQPVTDRWRETLDKLYRRVMPHRPITLLPVRAPAEAPAGM